MTPNRNEIFHTEDSGDCQCVSVEYTRDLSYGGVHILSMCTIGWTLKRRQRCIRHEYFEAHANHVHIDIRAEHCVFVHLQTSAAVNVALGKPAYQTDDYDVTADRAVDGNTSPNMKHVGSCTHTKSFNASWWVNLQQIFLIQSVKIFNRNDCCGLRLTNVELYVRFSERGFQLREGFRQVVVGLSHTFELATPVYGQWVRITRNPPVEYLTLCEVEGVPYSAGNNFGSSVFQGYVHTSTAIDVSKKVGSKLDCASRCSNPKKCISTHYNTATLTCILFDSLAFKKRDVENDVCDVNRIAITGNSMAQLFGT
ncbi:hypothetical protein DPMN_164124 [Dreissena polymorpha]|uniref:Fucolectin tachylectin-4 pentraxin-1 domain-containing protein n=1 Tax=Dreissena polymorpha TaxID=45954 RepID=A0A9D4ET46_DREPO|nr:hypothetical protein DPMN_164124 [Dreissena polymorpha]